MRVMRRPGERDLRKRERLRIRNGTGARYICRDLPTSPASLLFCRFLSREREREKKSDLYSSANNRAFPSRELRGDARIWRGCCVISPQDYHSARFHSASRKPPETLPASREGSSAWSDLRQIARSSRSFIYEVEKLLDAMPRRVRFHARARSSANITDLI